MNTSKRPFFAVLGFFSLSLAAAAAATACSNEDFTPDASGAQPDGDGGTTTPDAAGSPDGGSPDAAAQPDAAPCIPTGGEDRPDDDFADTNCDGIDGDVTHGVFVSPAGSDGAEGSMAAPVASIGKAVALAQAAQKDVYVCNGTYAENVVIETTGVALFGGYDCTKGWTRSSERARIAPGSGIPLRIKSANDTAIDRLELSAPAGVDPGESSIAATVETSTGVVLNRAELIAADAAPGKPGTPATANTTPAISGAAGANVAVSQCLTANPPAGACKQAAAGGVQSALVQCDSPLKHRGGDGGKGGNVYLKAATQKGANGLTFGAKGGQPGFAGSPGQPGQAGTAGEPGGKFGSVVDGVYVPSNAGTDATAGKMGEAAGGGSGGETWWVPDVGAWYVVGAGGGQGGYPGCGGDGGKAGGGGGASIALIATGSDITIRWSKLKTGAGGDGGAPSDGAAGQPGGKGGAGGSCSTGSGCEGKPGGDGGSGGKGGPGGPGGGGPSIGILTTGATPTTDAVTFDLGAPGNGASGFDGKSAASGEAGDIVTVSSTP